MKKTRNTFFTEANMNYANFPTAGMPVNMPVQSSMNYNSFYSGPNMNGAQGMPNMSMQGVAPTDLESRLAKIERQMTRLEHRIAKLESSNTYINEDFESTTNNMYML